jgi:hypothetical protein
MLPFLELEEWISSGGGLVCFHISLNEQHLLEASFGE